MARIIVDQARHIDAIAQQCRNTCWLTCYEMLLKGSNRVEDTSQNGIEKRLRAGGVDVTTAKAQGLLDSDFPKAQKALKMKGFQPQDVVNIHGMRQQLQLRGALWLAIRMSDDKGAYYHVVLVLGVDTDKEQLYYVDPWRDTPWDIVEKKWVSFSGMTKAIQGTAALVAGCQSVNWQA